MKAWLVRERDSEYATVVFAETRGKARSLAMATDACEDADFCDTDVSRKPQLDRYYKEGKKEMDWYDDKDRLALVKEAGFYCVDSDLVECDQCPAKKYCTEYEAKLEYLKDCEEYTEGGAKDE